MHERAMFHYGIALDLKPSATDAAAIKVISLKNNPDALKFINNFHSSLIFRSLIALMNVHLLCHFIDC